MGSAKPPPITPWGNPVLKGSKMSKEPTIVQRLHAGERVGFDFWDKDWCVGLFEKQAELFDTPASFARNLEGELQNQFCQTVGLKKCKSKNWPPPFYAPLSKIHFEWIDHPRYFTFRTQHFNSLRRAAIFHNYGNKAPEWDRIGGEFFRCIRLPKSFYAPDECTAWLVLQIDRFPQLSRSRAVSETPPQGTGQ
jgi:hypothetical protein